MHRMIDWNSAPLAAFEIAASSFDRSVFAAHDAVIGEHLRSEHDRLDVLLNIAGMIRQLKREAGTAIGLLATSNLAEHHAMADSCHARLADAVNLHRAASRCIRQGIAPPLPSREAPLTPRAEASKQQQNADPVWPAVWAMAWAWYVPWMQGCQ
jgi:hypothetical protein